MQDIFYMQCSLDTFAKATKRIPEAKVNLGKWKVYMEYMLKSYSAYSAFFLAQNISGKPEKHWILYSTTY